MNVKISLIAVSFFPIVILYSGYFFSKIAQHFQEADEAEGILSSVVQENLTGVRVVRAFGRESFERKRFDEKNERFAGLWTYLGKFLSLYWSIGDYRYSDSYSHLHGCVIYSRWQSDCR